MRFFHGSHQLSSILRLPAGQQPKFGSVGLGGRKWGAFVGERGREATVLKLEGGRPYYNYYNVISHGIVK